MSILLHISSCSATTSVGLYCTGVATRLEPHPGTLGDWLAASRCDPGTAICGYRQQVDPHNLLLDDTSLNQVDLACCPARQVGCRGQLVARLAAAAQM